MEKEGDLWPCLHSPSQGEIHVMHASVDPHGSITDKDINAIHLTSHVREKRLIHRFCFQPNPNMGNIKCVFCIFPNHTRWLPKPQLKLILLKFLLMLVYLFFRNAWELFLSLHQQSIWFYGVFSVTITTTSPQRQARDLPHRLTPIVSQPIEERNNISKHQATANTLSSPQQRPDTSVPDEDYELAILRHSGAHPVALLKICCISIFTNSLPRCTSSRFFYFRIPH
jgi:hypothetical protein